MTKMSKEALARLDEEIAALQEKMMKLSEFIYSSLVFKGLEMHDQNLLNLQFSTMKTYLDILKMRRERVEE